MTGGFYYAPPTQITSEFILLKGDESRHLTRVMRATVGTEIQVVDGVGGWYTATVDDIGRNHVRALITAREREVGEPHFDLTLCVGVLHNVGRFETLLEKAVELGASAVLPWRTDRTQKSRLNRGRCVRVMAAAMKQSMRSRLPSLLEVTSMGDAVARFGERHLRFLAHEGTASTNTLLGYVDEIRGFNQIVVAIGPEGGFSDAEVDLATAAGWHVVSLGPSRLRAETAAMAAAASIQMIKSEQHGSD